MNGLYLSYLVGFVRWSTF